MLFMELVHRKLMVYIIKSLIVIILQKTIIRIASTFLYDQVEYLPLMKYGDESKAS